MYINYLPQMYISWKLISANNAAIHVTKNDNMVADFRR